MIPYFKHKGTLAALDDIEKSKVVDVSKYPKGVVADLKGYDESVFFFYGYHPFVFVDTKNQKKERPTKNTDAKNCKEVDFCFQKDIDKEVSPRQAIGGICPLPTTTSRTIARPLPFISKPTI